MIPWIKSYAMAVALALGAVLGWAARGAWDAPGHARALEIAVDQTRLTERAAERAACQARSDAAAAGQARQIERINHEYDDIRARPSGPVDDRLRDGSFIAAPDHPAAPVGSGLPAGR